MEIIFLGTSSAVHSKERNQVSIAVKAFGKVMLFDCGEGTQRQLIFTNVSPMKIDRIFISHFHGDHILGLPGLLQSLSLSEREKKLTIYGPKGLNMLESAIYSLGYCKIEFPVEFVEIDTGTVIETDEYIISAQQVRHNVPCLAYSIEEKKRPKFLREKAIELGVPVGPLFGELQKGNEVEVNGQIIKPEQVLGDPRKGIKITYSGDSRPCEEMIHLAKDSTLLIHEATFLSDDASNAQEHGHSTTHDAAYIAQQSNSEKLILTHLSTRYADSCEKIFLKEAQEIFENTEIAYDFMEYKLR